LGFDLASQGWRANRRVSLATGLGLCLADLPGAGRPLLLLHGFTDHGISYQPLLRGLSGHSLIIPDLRGHGASDQGESYCISDFSDDIESLIDRLALDRPVLVGHSLGAIVATDLASRMGDRIGGLITLAGTLRPDGPATAHMQQAISGFTDPINPADPFFADWHAGAEKVSPAFHESLVRAACAMPVSVWQSVIAEVGKTDLAARAAQVAAPALVIGGADDPIFGPAHHRALAAALRAEAHLLPDTSHNPHWQHPDIVAALIRDFLARQA